MNRLSYRIYRLFTGVRHRLPRRFTPAGLLVLAALCASGAIGIDMDQTVGFQGFAPVACLLAIAMFMAPFFRGRFAVERVLPRYGSVGQPFTYPVTVRNLGGKAWRSLEWLEELEDPRPTFLEYTAGDREARRGPAFRIKRNPAGVSGNRQAAAFKPAPLPPLPPRGGAETRVELTPLRRGPLRLTGVTVARPDPFGLFRGFVRVPKPATVLILPKRYLLPSIPLPGTRRQTRSR